jgi:hypothetical protein
MNIKPGQQTHTVSVVSKPLYHVYTFNTFRWRRRRCYIIVHKFFNSVNISLNGILINLSTDVYSKNLILTDDFLIISYHVDLGSEGESIVYNFKTKQFYGSDFYAIELTSKSEILVENDYYDSRDINDPKYEGHIFETGTYNLLSNKYTFITKE